MDNKFINRYFCLAGVNNLKNSARNRRLPAFKTNADCVFANFNGFFAWIIAVQKQISRVPRIRSLMRPDFRIYPADNLFCIRVCEINISFETRLLTPFYYVVPAGDPFFSRGRRNDGNAVIRNRWLVLGGRSFWLLGLLGRLLLRCL